MLEKKVWKAMAFYGAYNVGMQDFFFLMFVAGKINTYETPF